MITSLEGLGAVSRNNKGARRSSAVSSKGDRRTSIAGTEFSFHMGANVSQHGASEMGDDPPLISEPLAVDPHGAIQGAMRSSLDHRGLSGAISSTGQSNVIQLQGAPVKILDDEPSRRKEAAGKLNRVVKKVGCQMLTLFSFSPMLSC